MPRNPDQIVISRLEIFPCIGATEEERASPQRMLATLILEPVAGFAGAGDRLENTVDYASVALAVKNLAATGHRALVETLAEEISALLLHGFPLAAVEVELHKFILPDTGFVGVRIRRER